jgi:hypothetical protein
MLEDGAKLRRRSGLPVGVIVAGLAVIAGLAGAYFLYQEWQKQAPLLPILTEEAKQYLPSLDLGNVEMAAEDSFLEQTIVTITGEISNNGDKTLRAVDVNCVFRDPYEQELRRELVRIVGRGRRPLEPGGTGSFRLAFDNAPAGWNQVMPNLYIAQIVFQE